MTGTTGSRSTVTAENSPRSDGDGGGDSRPAVGVEPIVTYTCGLEGEHTIPSPDVRVLKSGDGGFIVACTCAGEPLEETDEQPHPTRDHLAGIDANAPDPSEWLRLEDAADGWYDVEPWEPPEGFTGTRLQRRARVAERAKELADDVPKPIGSNHDDRHEAAREVRCPACDANPGRKCQRPSDHRVRKCHADRLETAEAEGVLDAESSGEGDSSAGETTQADLTAGWSA